MKDNDFSKGSVWKHIMSLAIPMMTAQLVQVLYSVVDRVYIGHMDGTSALALTGLGLTFPIITIISAFTYLFGMGGAPLCSIARGMRDEKRAERIIGNTFVMLCITAVVITACGYIFLKDLLYLFGASDITYPYAKEYMYIYLIGTPFVMIGTGMNGFINSQGFAKTGMITVVVGAVVNILLDPLFIFVFDMGIKGAAVATIISQFVSAVWVMAFLLGKKTLLKLNKEGMKLSGKLVKEIAGLGCTGFIMAATNGAVQIACNKCLSDYGGDLYVGIMTVLNSVREMFILPVQGITNGAQPVIGFNYGAKEYERVKKAIGCATISCIVYTVAIWLVIIVFSDVFLRMFTADAEIIQYGKEPLKIYFFGFFMMALQFSGQSTFVALGQAKHAVFFSLMRKIFIVVPLTIILPKLWNLGVNGVFIAEPVSNAVGGIICFVTMLFVVKRLLENGENNVTAK